MTETRDPFLVPLDGIAKAVCDVVEPVIDGAGFELVKFVLVRSANKTVVRLFVDVDASNDARVVLEQLGRLNRLLGDVVDVEDDAQGWFGGAYELEVSSPGVDRPLTRKSHFAAASGKRVKVKKSALGAASQTLDGVLGDVDDDGFAVGTGEEATRVAWDEVRQANVVFEFPRKEKPGKKRRR